MTCRRFPVLVFLAALPFAPAPAAAAYRVAVLVGANRGAESDEELAFATRDAKKLRDVLVEVSRVKSPDALILADPQPAQLRQAIARAAGLLAASRDRETVFFFYSAAQRCPKNQTTIGTGQRSPERKMEERSCSRYL